MRSFLGWLFCGVLLVGCASTQLNYNTLDLASTADHLLTAQVLRNLANFIDSPAAIPSQIVINGGTTTTANTITPSFTDPVTKAITAGTSVVKSAASPTTLTNSAVTASKTATISGSNVSTQNWAFDPVSDPDQLRRLLALYRFAVEGNDNPYAQERLARDYPLSYKTNSKDGTVSIDLTALTGPNCVLCGRNALPISTPCDISEYPRADTISGVKKYCVSINPRLLPVIDSNTMRPGGRWLLWRSLPTIPRSDSNPPPTDNDILLGQYGNHLLFVDRTQADRLAEFELFIAVAANSSLSPSSSTGSGNQTKPKGATAIPTGIILSGQ